MLAEMIMVEPPDKGEGSPPNLAGKVSDYLYAGVGKGQQEKGGVLVGL
jgi:hypothetical protein